MAKTRQSKPAQYIQPSHLCYCESWQGDVVLLQMQQTLEREAEWKLLKHPNKGILILTAVCILKY